MRDRWSVAVAVALSAIGSSLGSASAGDSYYGKVTAVKSADLVRLEAGKGGYDIRIVGIEVPKEPALAERSRQFVEKLLLGKNARMRLEGRSKSGEMLARLFTDDRETGIRDVGAELVRAGLARRKPRVAGYAFGYKYGELDKAEAEARKARRGLWSTTKQ